MSEERHRLVRILVAGFHDIEEWRLGDPALARAKGYPREYPLPGIDDYGAVFADVVIDAATGEPICHEINGPNAVGSDALTGDSSLRADLEARQAARHFDGAPAVTLHAHQHWRTFRTGGEFYPRVELFAERLAALARADVRMRGAHEPLGDERISVVMGDVPSVAAHLRATDGRFHYRDRPVCFIGNPNLLPELQRTRKSAKADLRVFHASRLTHLFHDKGRQQDLLEGTGIRPLRHFEAATKEEALTRCRAIRAPFVLKPNATSGGTGVHVVIPGMADAELRARIDAVVNDCAAKYGENFPALPIRGFEFVRSTACDGRLWDLRIAVLFEPRKAHVFPVSIRLAPTPFDATTFHLDRDQWISNVSGREVTLLRSGMDDATLAAVGMTAGKLERVFRACVDWTARAWAPSYEDECEAKDPSFYPVEKFR